MSREVILATETENISLTGNNETYTKTEIDEKIKTIQNAGGVGKIVYSGTFTSDGSCNIPVDIDYAIISGSYTIAVNTSIQGPTYTYTTTFSLRKLDNGTYRISNTVNASNTYTSYNFSFVAYKYF